MFRWLSRIFFKKSLKTSSPRPRSLRLERFEDRSMLAPMADVVFLVDESVSGTTAGQWLDEAIDTIDAQLRTTSGIDVRYGVVGYGNDTADYGNNPFARSHLMSGAPYSAGSDQADDVQGAIASMNFAAGGEDGWDAIEHAIAEYPFRNGAVPVLLLQPSCYLLAV
jgi:hypothetical protein